MQTIPIANIGGNHKMISIMTRLFRVLLVSCLMVCCVQTADAENFGRAPQPSDAVMLDGQWDVFLTDDSRVELPLPTDGKSLSVNISPTSFDAQGWSGLHEQYNHAWYSRKITLPTAWQGRRILLAIDRCRWEARVFLNGKSVGMNTGMSPFVLDVTEAAKPGEENELLVVATGVVAFLKDRDKDLEKLTAAERKVFLSNYAFQMSSPKLADRWIYRLIDFEGGYKLGLQGGWFYSESTVYIPDAFIKPSVRKESLTVDISLRNKSERDVVCKLAGKVLDGQGKTALEIPGKPVHIKASSDVVVTITQPWKNPRLWDTNVPYLYTMVCELSQNDHVIATRKTEFGFREFWSQGDQYILNGKPIHLFTEFQLYDPTPRLNELRSQGYNSILLCGGRLPHRSMDILDKTGIPIGLDTQVQFESGHHQADKSDPRYWEMMKNDFDSMVRQYRNHPAILKWGMSNEYYVSVEENSIAHFSEIKKYLQSQIDDTRLYVCRGDWLPDFMDIRSIHGAPHADYPNSYGLGDTRARQVTLIPNNGYLWRKVPLVMSKKSGLSEVPMPSDKPIMLDENAYLFWMRSMDPLTVLEGDNVYSQSTLNRVEDLQKGYVGILHPYNIMANRFRSTVGSWIFQANRLNQIAEVSPHAYGLFGEYANPAFKERTKLYQAVFDQAFAPVTFYVHTFSEHYYDDELPVITVSIHNDSRVKKQLVLMWNAGSDISDQRTYELDAGMMKEDRVAVKPVVKGPVQQRIGVDIDFQLMEEGRQLKTIHKQIEVFPRVKRLVPVPATQPVVYDPTGILQVAMQTNGVGCISLKDIHTLKDQAPGTTLLIGSGALENQNIQVNKSLVEFARQGGRIVLFRQPEPASWIPARFPLIDNSVDSTIAFVAAPGHPLMQGLAANDFKFWRGKRDELLDWNVVSLNNYLIPTSGNFVPVLMAGGPEGLVYSPLIEFFVGKGSIIGCQLLLTEKLGREPVADILFRNLIHYVTATTTGRSFQTSGLIAGVDKDGAELVRQAGVAITPIATSAISSTKQSVIFVHASAIHAVESSALQQRLQAGGTVFIYGLSTTEQVTELGTQLGLPLTAEQSKRDDLPLSKAVNWAENPLLQGVNNGMFFWARDVSMATGGGESAAMKFNYDRSVADIVLTNSAATNLIGHGDRSVLTVMPVGAGRLILSTLRWDKPLSPDVSNRSMRLLSILATNLGIDVNPFGSVVPVDPTNTFQVDLRPYTNMGFADDVADNGKGGWTDEGPTNDMRGMPVGMQMFTDRQIPFDIIDPARNAGKSVRLLGCKKNEFPRQVSGIPVGRKAAKLYFLHACGWAGEPAKYVVHYADGNTVEIPIINGAQIGDWWSTAARTRASMVPIINNYHMYKAEGNADFTVVKATRYLSCYTWENPHPDKVVQAVDMATEAQATRFVLVAITGQIEPDETKSGIVVNKIGSAFKVQNAATMTLAAGEYDLSFGLQKSRPIYHVVPFITVLGKEYSAAYATRKLGITGELKNGIWNGTQRVEFDVAGSTVPVEIGHEMTDATGDRVNITWTQSGELEKQKAHVSLAQIMYWDAEDGKASFVTSSGMSGLCVEETPGLGKPISASVDPEKPSFILTTVAGESIKLFLEPGSVYQFSVINRKNINQPAKSVVMYLYPAVSRKIASTQFGEPLTWWYRVQCEPAKK